MAASLEDEEDEQMKLAIALSLQPSNPVINSVLTDQPSTAKTIIDLTDDDRSGVTQAPSAGNHELASTLLTQSLPIDTPTGLLGLDRRAMEQERLARKRKAPISPPVLSKHRKVMPDESTASGSQYPVPKPNGLKTRSTASFATASQPSMSKLSFPKGVVKKTWAYGFPRERDIKLEEVLDRSNLVSAVLSSFQWDIEWLLQKIDTRRTNITLVMQAKDEATKLEYTRDTAEMPNLRLCFPSMQGIVNCMHSKLMLLTYSTHLRVVIPTANLVPYDWGDGGIMENMVFLIDLPRLPQGQPRRNDTMTFFGEELIYFCQAMGLQQDIIQKLPDFDFTATKDMAFIHSIGGMHQGADEPWRRTGYCGLGRAVRHLGLQSDEVSIDFVASSIGAVTLDFLSTLYLAARGDDGTTEFNWRTAPKPKEKKGNQAAPAEASARDELHQSLASKFRIYFPSHTTVMSSKGGAGAGGPICFSSKWHSASSFPRQSLRDCTSVRAGLLMHNKLLFVRPQRSLASNGSMSTSEAADSHQQSRPWLYVGSANCSESAWGRLVLPKPKPKAQAQPQANIASNRPEGPKLNCRNWECGVLLPVQAQVQAQESGTVSSPAASAATTTSDKFKLHSLDGLDGFETLVPIPMRYPGADMMHAKPWFAAEQ